MPQHVVRQLGDDSQHHKVHLQKTTPAFHISLLVPSLESALLLLLLLLFIIIIITIIIIVVVVVIIILIITITITIIITITVTIVTITDIMRCAAVSPACTISCIEKNNNKKTFPAHDELGMCRTSLVSPY